VIFCAARAIMARNLGLRATQELLRLAPAGKGEQHARDERPAREREYQPLGPFTAGSLDQQPRPDRDQRHADEHRQHPQLHREQGPDIRLPARSVRRTVERRCVKNVIVFAVHLMIPIEFDLHRQ